MSRQKSLAAGVIRIPWKSATVIPTRKHTISSVFLERFLPPVITPGVLSLTLYSIVIRSDLIQLLYKLIRCNLDVFITLWYFVSNSLNRYLKSAGCIFLDYSFFLDLIPYSLLFRTSDFSDVCSMKCKFYNKNSTKYLDYHLSNLFSKNSNVPQTATLSSYPHTVFINDLSVDSHVRLMIKFFFAR